MKGRKKIISAVLSAVLLGSFATPVFAQTVPSEKEEVIYIMTDASGRVTDMEAVNIFSGGDITDYGDYSAVKALNTTDQIVQNGDKITFSSSADRVYYQGTMKDTEAPWNISIRYFLDGKEYSAEEIAGKSGAMELRFSVSKNENCRGSFYEEYALQASFTLNTNRCKNIVSDGATTANVGENRQLTYTILPGRGIDTVIKADVTEFKMDSVSINGIRLTMNLEVDDAALTEQVDELVSAIGDLNEGALEVRNGTGTLYDATETLNDKVGELNNGVGSLTDGAGKLDSGLKSITAENEQLTGAAYAAYEGLCTAAAAALNNLLEANGMDTVTLTPTTYSAVLLKLLERMNADTVYQEAYAVALWQVTKQVEEQAVMLYRGYLESQADSVYLTYLTSQADQIYTQFAAQAVYEQLLQSGYTEAQATAFLQSSEGQASVAQAAANLSEEQKEQILNAAAARLTQEQKSQIFQGALDSLTDEQKMQIREGAIRQAMASEEVTAQINASVEKVGLAAGQISELKGQLDQYGAFYRGLIAYVEAVSDAAAGAKELTLNMNTLYENTGVLWTSVGNLNDAVGKLYDGTKELADGTGLLTEKTSDMNVQIREEIDSVTASVSGSDAEVVSFVSDQNTRVASVQFVIKTAAIEEAEPTENVTSEEVSLTVWQKLLHLFGIY